MTTLYTFRINTGSHVDENNKRHLRGSKFTTKNNLLKHNLPGENRFELLDKNEVKEGEDTLPSAESEDDEDEIEYSDMTVAQLREYATENEIDLDDAKSKVDIIAAIELAEEDA